MSSSLYDRLVRKEASLAVIGLGYVGLPIALAFARKLKVVGFDINQKRVDMMRRGEDPSNELAASEFEGCDIHFTADIGDLKDVEFFIVAVPTPIDDQNIPDLRPLLGATRTVGQVLKKGDHVVYESTVYPGCTEEDCVPLLEQLSGLKCVADFKVGYSPERINPGDKEHTLERIVKVTSGCDAESAETVARVYELVVKAGVHRASSIKVAEAAKVIENTQRDLNIALMNELALIFDRIGIDTLEVLQAVGTKWNFLPFRPGLVGGHCIGVDPSPHPQGRSSGLPPPGHPRRPAHQRRHGRLGGAADGEDMINNGSAVKGAKVIVLGLTFKEDCPDLRNSKVADLVKELQSFGCDVAVHDPIAENHEAEHEYGIRLTPWDQLPNGADAIVAAVSHKQYMAMPLSDILGRLKQGGVFTDVKSAYDPAALKAAGFTVWRL